ncbi:hypothetical protein BCR33DRAFT_185764 [Rhizoclosmatium globosum]|uniref:Uncharacterized protein n=1 Tax=Rhizoclosmatium globosum TaxID=329046 RepID=A0A1Y2D1J5_9FUNG|nr:hypothetical protein BCR33DRAFT_185764 [Rhizoclosmatium globosum]|eukprot:ORY53067.1 hypothetical protein BCR33DRAFT_185764 [Rhizoclosmatium globosum]
MFHSLRQGHGYIVPESKGKSGPSPVYVVEAQDGLLPAHTSVGQLASQRTAAPPRPLALKPHLSFHLFVQLRFCSILGICNPSLSSATLPTI